MKQYLLLLLFLCTSFFSFANVSTTVTSTGGSGAPSTTYPSLNAAITAINGGAHTGTIVCTSAAGSETAPVGGYKVTKSGTAAAPISFIGTGVTLTAGLQTAGNINDAVLKFLGVSYCTVQGFTIKENAANTTFSLTAPSGNTMTEFGIDFNATATNGCSNNLVQGNTISMSPTYPAAVGIFFNSASLDNTTAMGNNTGVGSTQATRNNNNQVYSNTITNVVQGITFLGWEAGGTTIFDQGNDIGGVSAATGNSITNFGGVGATATAMYTGTYNTENPNASTGSSYVAGIYVINQAGHNISFNTINGATAGQGIYGIYDYGSTALSGPPTITYTTTVNNNTITVANTGGGTNSGSVVGMLVGCLAGTGAIGSLGSVAETAYIQNNTIVGGGFTNATNPPFPSPYSGITIAKTAKKFTVSNNTIQNITIANTASGFRGIVSNTFGSGTNDTILYLGNHLGTAGNPLVTFAANSNGNVQVMAIGSAGMKANNPISYIKVQGNDIQNIINTGAATASQYQKYILVSAMPFKEEISSNTFTNITGVNTLGSVAFITPTSGNGMPAGGFYIADSNRIVTAYKNAGTSGSVTLMADTTSFATTGTIRQVANNFSNITVAGTTSILGWLSTTGTNNAGMIKNVSYDTLMSWSGGSGNITGMTVSKGGLDTVSHNLITGFTVSAGTNLATNVTGLLIPGGANNDIFKNKICNHEDKSSLGTVYGLSITGSPINLAYDNVIGDYRTPNANFATDAIIGINLNNAVASTNKIYNNSIKLDASSVGANFNTAGIYENTLPTTANYYVSYNIVDNNSIAGSTGIVTAIHRSSTDLTNYETTSIRNVLYGGTPSTKQLLFYDGTNKYQTIGTLQAGVGGGRETPSYTENTSFQYTSCDDLYYLRIANGTPSLAEGNAITVPEVATDYAEVIRPYNNMVPDIGAYEFSLSSPIVPDTVKKTPTTPTSSVTVCATADNITVSGTTTYTTCGTATTFGSWIQNAAGCLVFTGNGTQKVGDTVRNCVIACNGTVCDTTYIVINPVIVPDTVVKTPTTPTSTVTVCPTADNITVSGTTTYSSCNTPTTFGSWTQNASGCLVFTGNGTQKVGDTVRNCVIACNGTVCDTTFIVINPVIVPDTVSKTPTTPTSTVTVCPTADNIKVSGTTTYSSCNTPTTFGSWTQNASGCMVFTGNGTQKVGDTVRNCVIACNGTVCDTTYIVINPVIVPDTVTKTPTSPTSSVTVCPTADNIKVSGTTTYSSCNTPTTFGSWTQNAAGCLVFTGNGTQKVGDTVRNCVIACNGTVCDTTFIVINPVIVPDTVSKTPTTPTSSVTVCPTADNIKVSGTTTYSSCNTPTTFGSWTQNAAGCLVFTGNGTQKVGDMVRNCVIACNGTVCDTTYIVINPVIVPDTVSKTPTTPTSTVTVCPTADNIKVSGTTTYSSCNTPTTFGSWTQNASGCLVFTGNGTQKVGDTVRNCVIACNGTVCDTTYIVINPVIVPDTVTKTPATPTTPVTVCPTADNIKVTGTTTYSTCGTATTFGSWIQNAAGCLVFTGNGTQKVGDTVRNCVIACNGTVCDTTYIVINPVILPDTIIKKPTCPTCPLKICATADNIKVNGTTTYSSCGLTSSFGSFVLDLNGCLIWHGNGTQTAKDSIKSCVVACNGTVCDTTYVIIIPATPPYGPDTIHVTPSCSTCPIAPVCPTGDDIPSGYTNKTYHNCGISGSQSSQGSLVINASGCAVWTPNGTQKDTIKTCVVVCADTVISGTTFTVCDTTYIIINPAPIPDTVIKTPTTPTTPVIVCPTADNITINSSTTFSTCGTTSTFGIWSTPNAITGCMVWTPNGTQKAGDTVKNCVVACNGTVCDTTYIIINPVIVPDTVTKTPTSPTSSVTVCPTADNIKVSGTTTYSTCNTPSTFGSWIQNTEGCLVFTGNGTQKVGDTVKNCVIACNGTVCDTTYIRILPNVVPLNVNWLGFNISNTHCLANLVWQVSSLANTSYFEIQKSSNSANWNTIGKVTDIDRTKLEAQFTYTDNELLTAANSYYRLKEIELNGNTNYSEVRYANCKEGYSINIYPNPVEDKLTISFTRESDLEPTIMIYNMAGQRVQTSLIKNTNNKELVFSLSHLASGVYTIIINDNDFGKSTYKVMKK